MRRPTHGSAISTSGKWDWADSDSGRTASSVEAGELRADIPPRTALNPRQTRQAWLLVWRATEEQRDVDAELAALPAGNRDFRISHLP